MTKHTISLYRIFFELEIKKRNLSSIRPSTGVPRKFSAILLPLLGIIFFIKLYLRKLHSSAQKSQESSVLDSETKDS